MATAEMPFSAHRLREGPWDFPPPERTDKRHLYKAMYQLLNYLSIEWCGGDIPAHLQVSFGCVTEQQSYDLVIIITNVDAYVKKGKLDEVFTECHVLHPFLDLSVTVPSVMVAGSLSSYIKHYHRMWVTPRGVLCHELPILSRDSSSANTLYLFIDFRGDIQMKAIKDLIYYFVMRMDIGCSDNLHIDLRFGANQPRSQIRFPGQFKPGSRNTIRSDGRVNVKPCRSCQSCRIQSTKSKEMFIRNRRFEVKLCTRQCSGSDSRCADRKFKGKLTILGPGSIPVLWQRDDEFHAQFNSLVQNWPCMAERSAHLILVFECPVSRDNVHEIMELLRDTCYEVFSKHQASFKSSVRQLLSKPAMVPASRIAVDLSAASKHLARGISEIVEMSKNEDFRAKVKNLMSYDSFESLQESILNKSRRFGVRESAVTSDVAVFASPDSARSSSTSLPPAKRQKTVQEGSQEEEEVDGYSNTTLFRSAGVTRPRSPDQLTDITIDGFHFIESQSQPIPVTRDIHPSVPGTTYDDDLSDFESLQ